MDGLRVGVDRLEPTIQQAAGIHLECPDRKDHDCTPACHVYGFHDERRAFATYNAPRMSATELQRLMQHTSFEITQKYIKYSEEMQAAAANVYVPVLPSIGGN